LDKITKLRLNAWRQPARLARQGLRRNTDRLAKLALRRTKLRNEKIGGNIQSRGKGGKGHVNFPDAIARPPR
ncbi:MAG: hypothetical protein WA979_00600, partial [Pacificimonas sp.]